MHYETASHYWNPCSPDGIVDNKKLLQSDEADEDFLKKICCRSRQSIIPAPRLPSLLMRG